MNRPVPKSEGRLRQVPRCISETPLVLSPEYLSVTEVTMMRPTICSGQQTAFHCITIEKIGGRIGRQGKGGEASVARTLARTIAPPHQSRDRLFLLIRSVFSIMATIATIIPTQQPTPTKLAAAPSKLPNNMGTTVIISHSRTRNWAVRFVLVIGSSFGGVWAVTWFQFAERILRHTLR